MTRSTKNAALAVAAIAWLATPASAQNIDGPPQMATAEDMALFQPYIGRFRSEDRIFDDSEIRYHFEVDYAWYDRLRSIVRYELAMVIPEQERRREVGSGFYYLDRVNNRIGVFGAFPDGRVGSGTMGAFDRATSARTVWVNGVGPDGSITQVHDHFEVIDEDSWRNVTHIRQGEGEWQQISSGVYSRVADDANEVG